MKIPETIFLCFFFVSTSFSQRIEWGEEDKLQCDYPCGSVKTPGYDMVGIYENVIVKYRDNLPYPGYNYLKNIAEVNITEYDSESLKILRSVKFKPKDYCEKGEHYMGMTFIGDNSYAIMAKKNEESRLEIYTRVMEYDEPYIREEYKSIGMIDRYNILKNSVDYKLYNSESKNEKVRGFYSFHKNPNDDGLRHIFKVFFRDESRWESFEYETPETSKFHPSYFVVGNSGSLAVVGHTGGIGRYIGDNMAILYKFKDQDFMMKQIELDEVKLLSSTVMLTEYEEILIFGQYSTKTGQGANGWFTQLISENSSKGVQYNRYEDSFIMELWNESARKFEEKNVASDPYYLKTTIPEIYDCDDKSKMIIFRVTQDKNLENPEYIDGFYPKVRAHFVVIRISQEGELIWKKNIFTNRKAISMKDLSMVSREQETWFRENKLFILFNEDYNEEKGKQYKTRLISLDTEGNIQEEFAEPVSKNEFVLRPEFCHDLDNGLIFIYSSTTKEQKIGFLELR
jgi:hypothetical protein